MNANGKLCQLGQVLRGCRRLHITNLAAAYEGPGKTTVTFINKELSSRLAVTHCDTTGFILNTGTRIIGPAILFPRYALCWNIISGKHINSATLSLFTVLEPKPDLLVIGLDDNYDFTYRRNLQEFMKKHKFAAEVVSVHNACKVFNYVNEEGRYVVAALIPPKVTTSNLKKLPKRDPVKEISSSRTDKDSKDDSAKAREKSHARS